jgi:hypothetical protein
VEAAGIEPVTRRKQNPKQVALLPANALILHRIVPPPRPVSSRSIPRWRGRVGGRRGTARVRRRLLRRSALARPLAESHPRPVSSTPLIEPDVQFSCIRLSDRSHVGRIGADVHAAPTSCTCWLHLGLRVQLRSEIFELCRGCRLTPISRCVLSSPSILNQGPFPPRSLPASSVVRAPPTPGLRHTLTACSGCHPARTRSPVLRTSPCAHMPRPTTPVECPAMPRRPSRWTRGLPCMCARSASTIALSGPARASLTLRPASLLDLLSEAFCLWASSPRVTPRPRQIATEGSTSSSGGTSTRWSSAPSRRTHTEGT